MGEDIKTQSGKKGDNCFLKKAVTVTNVTLDVCHNLFPVAISDKLAYNSLALDRNLNMRGRTQQRNITKAR